MEKFGRSLWVNPSRLLATAVIQPVCVLLLVLLFALMSASAIWRYALHSPLTWADEACTFLFLWFGMLGAVLSSYRNEHMRLPMIFGKNSKNLSEFLDTFGQVLMAALLLALVPAAVAYTKAEWPVLSPALALPDGLRGAGIVIGLVLLLFFDLSRLWERAKFRDLAISLVLVLLLGTAALAMSKWGDLGKFNLLIYLVLGVGLCVAISVPIGYAFGIGAASYVIFSTRFDLEIVVGRLDEGMSHLVLLSIPLFIALGVLMELSGISKALVKCLFSLVGHIKGGLQYVLIGAMLLVSGISGSKAADMAAVAPPLLPEMNKRGASKPELVALLAATGAQTETIPPSFVLIVLGSVTGISIGALFAGGILPAVVAGIALALVCGYKARNQISTGQRASVREMSIGIIYAIPALLLPFLVRALVVEGVTTATEVAAFGIIYSVFVGVFFYRSKAWTGIYARLVHTASLTGSIMLILGMATGVSWALAQSGFSRDLAQFMIELPGGRNTFMVVSILLFVLLGSVLEGIPAIVLFGPLLFPIAQKFGIHDVHYAMVAILSMGLGLFSPPLGVGFYTACAIGDTAPGQVVKLIWPSVVSQRFSEENELLRPGIRI